MATSRPAPQISPRGAGSADAARLAGQRARAGKRRGARPGGGPRAARSAPADFSFQFQAGRAQGRHRRWRTSSGRTSSACCAKRSTTSRARRAFWISTAPRCTTSCAATACGEAHSSRPAGRCAATGQRGAGLDLLEHLAASLARAFRMPCRVRPADLDVAFALDARRGQYHSTAILQQLERACRPGRARAGRHRLRPIRAGADLRLRRGAARRRLRGGFDRAPGARNSTACRAATT